MEFNSSRRFTRRDPAFNQILQIFTQLIHNLNTQIQTIIPNTLANPTKHHPNHSNHSNHHRHRKEPKENKQIKQQKEIKEVKEHRQPKQVIQKGVVQNLGQGRSIKLRWQRDWQGLCSQRRQDIYGQYNVCFSYQIISQDDQNNNDSQS